MHEPVVDMVVHGEGVGLRFPGQHAERVGKEDAVVVLYEGAAGDVENDMGRVNMVVPHRGEQFCPLVLAFCRSVSVHGFLSVSG